MKTLKKPSLFILATLFAVATCYAQTAEEIVNKNIDAIGGRALLSSIKSVVIESSIDVNGNEAPSTTYILNGKGFKSETDFGGSKIIQCVTPSGGWSINPLVGQSTATAMPDEVVKQSQGQLNIGGPLLDYSANGGKIELLGKDTADYKIKLTNNAGTDATFYINMKTYMIDMIIAKLNMGGQEQETTIHFSDYRKVDNGPIMSFAQSRDLPQFTLNITQKKVEINKDIDPSIFDMPK
ncbi:MAG TPA: hypothetical protein VHE54_12110 [Puia sp.]|nr:hypothetical protein [Puia sp.]